MPPKWKREPAPKSVFYSWAKKAKQKQFIGTISSDEVIVIDDSQPTTSTGNNGPTMNQREDSWSPVPRSAIIPATTLLSGAPEKNPVNPIMRLNEQHTSDILLDSYGFDQKAGDVLLIPISEMIRPYEIDLLRRCIKHNAGIGLYSETSPSHIAAVIIINFLRFFPRGRCVFSCSTNTHLESFRERCDAVGIGSNDITVVESVAHFKKLKDVDIGRVIVCSPNVLIKLSELPNPSTVITDIRCIFFQFENAKETTTKYKKICTALAMKNIPCRVIAHCPKLPFLSKKTSSITARQLAITNMGLSEWTEIGLRDDRFRAHGVSASLSPLFWDNTQIDDNVQQWKRVWREECMIFLKRLSEMIYLPSTDPEELFYISWETVIKDAAVCSATLELATNVLFITEGYRNLTLHGPRAFYLYCYASLNDPSSTSRAFELQTFIAETQGIRNVFYEIQKQYDYVSGTPYDIRYQSKSVESHPKWKTLRNMVKKYGEGGRIFRGLVLCENTFASRVAGESLNGLDGVTVVHAVLNDQLIKDESLRLLHKSSNTLNGLFFKNITLVLILRVDLPLAYQSIDTACAVGLNFVFSMDRRSVCLLPAHSNDYIGLLSDKFETLRPEDGQQLDSFLTIQGKSSDELGVIDRYDCFNYESSKICLDVDRMKTKEYFRASVKGRSEISLDNNITSSTRCGFELSAAENAEFERRMRDCDMPKKGIMSANRDKRNSRFSICLTDDQLLWNDHKQLGVIRSSSLSERFLKMMSSDPIEIKRKRKYEFESDNKNNQTIARLDNLIRMLNTAFPV